MRKSMFVTVAVAVLGIGSIVARAEGLSADERAFIDKNISQLVKLEPEKLGGPGLEHVFKAPFYKVKVSINEGGGESSSTDLVVARVGDKLVPVSTPSTTEEVPQLKEMLNPDFKLASEKDAKTLQDALDTLYPISSSFGGEDLKAKAIKHLGNDWLFIRGKFFEKHKGYAFTTDSSGKITGVKYSLDLP